MSQNWAEIIENHEALGCSRPFQARFWSSLGMAPMGQGLRSVSELYLKAVRGLLHLQPHIPKLVPLKCAAMQRLASAHLDKEIWFRVY